MVACSPFSACVITSASDDGAMRTGARGSIISKVSPVTKRAALTLPSRYFAARSGRAGVSRGSSIAFAQALVDRARGLAFAALGPRRFRGWRPAIDIDVQPAFGGLDKALQEQRADDRAGKAAGRRVVDIGHLGIEPAIVGRPQRHSPQRIVLLLCQSRDVERQRLIIGVKGR